MENKIKYVEENRNEGLENKQKEMENKLEKKVKRDEDPKQRKIKKSPKTENYVETRIGRREKQHGNTRTEGRRCSDKANGRKFLEEVLNERSKIKFVRSTKAKK